MASSVQESPGTPPSPRPARAGSGLLQERAYAILKQRLLSETFPDGTLLSERQVAGDLGMSKTPVKAAFARLEQEGFLKISPQQGVVVRHLSAEEMAHHVELRIALETYAVRQIAEQGLEPSQWERLENHLAQQRRAARALDRALSVQLDGEFHVLLCECLNNPELLKVMSQVRDKMFRVMGRILHQHPHRIEETVEEHEAIAAAVREHRGHLAAELMAQHLERGREFLFSSPDSHAEASVSRPR